MSQTAAGTLIDVLEKIGVKQIFELIGDSLNPIADAVRHSKIEWRPSRGRGSARGRRPSEAHWSARRLLRNNRPGSTHLVAGLYEAGRSKSYPVAFSYG